MEVSGTADRGNLPITSFMTTMLGTVNANDGCRGRRTPNDQVPGGQGHTPAANRRNSDSSRDQGHHPLSGPAQTAYRFSVRLHDGCPRGVDLVARQGRDVSGRCINRLTHWRGIALAAALLRTN